MLIRMLMRVLILMLVLMLIRMRGTTRNNRDAARHATPNPHAAQQGAMVRFEPNGSDVCWPWFLICLLVAQA